MDLLKKFIEILKIYNEFQENKNRINQIVHLNCSFLKTFFHLIQMHVTTTYIFC